MKTIKLILPILFLVGSCFIATAQKLNKIEEFSAYDNEVQVLPGTVVVVHNDVRDGKTNQYALKSDRFVRLKSQQSSAAKNWSSFNWEDVDFRDQIDRSDFESISLASFVPPGSKVKGFGRVDSFMPGKTLVFICYTALETDAKSSEDQHDLHIMMLTRGPMKTGTNYEKIDDLLVAEESYFGALIVQPQPRGALIFLYSTSIGGSSHLINSVDVLAVSTGAVPGVSLGTKPRMHGAREHPSRVESTKPDQSKPAQSP